MKTLNKLTIYGEIIFAFNMTETYFLKQIVYDTDFDLTEII